MTDTNLVVSEVIVDELLEGVGADSIPSGAALVAPPQSPDIDNEIEAIWQRIQEFDKDDIQGKRLGPKPFWKEAGFWPSCILFILGITLALIGLYIGNPRESKIALIMLCLALLMFLLLFPIQVCLVSVGFWKTWKLRRTEALQLAHDVAKAYRPLGRELRTNYSRAAIIGASESLDMYEGMLDRRLASVLGKNLGGLIPVTAAFIPAVGLYFSMIKSNTLSLPPLVQNGIEFFVFLLFGAAVGGVLARHSVNVVPEYRAFLRGIANVMEVQEKEAKEKREREKDAHDKNNVE